MTAIGIDLGGTKIETRLFGPDWSVSAQDRAPTPASYPDLLAALIAGVARVRGAATARLPTGTLPIGTPPIGIGAPGIADPVTGRVWAANLAVSGQDVAGDLGRALGAGVLFLNDARALALSEARFGVGAGAAHDCVVCVILGTGVGGGVVRGGQLAAQFGGIGGEFGHMAAPAGIVAQFGLPLVRCGCGAVGCVETLISGPGLVRMTKALTGQDLTPAQIAARRGTDMAQVWAAWCALVADMLRTLTLTLDPDLVVLAGGLSLIDGVVADVTAAAGQAGLGPVALPPVVLAQGGDASGARGAAYAAWQSAQGAADD